MTMLPTVLAAAHLARLAILSGVGRDPLVQCWSSVVHIERAGSPRDIAAWQLSAPAGSTAKTAPALAVDRRVRRSRAGHGRDRREPRCGPARRSVVDIPDLGGGTGGLGAGDSAYRVALVGTAGGIDALDACAALGPLGAVPRCGDSTAAGAARASAGTGLVRYR